LRRDGDEQEREQAPEHVLGQPLRDEDAGLDAEHRGRPDDERGAPADVAEAMLLPRTRRDGREDGKQRRGFGLDLAEVGDENERRHEEDAAANAVEAREYACPQAEHGEEQDLQHLDREVHADGSEEGCEAEGERLGGQALLKPRAGDGADRGRHAEESGVERADLRVEGIGDHADECDEADCRERRRHGGPLEDVSREEKERHDDDPATNPEERAEEARNQADGEQPHRLILRSVAAETLVARLAEAPEAAAILLDVDGTLSPIVQRPEEATVPPETRAAVERLAGRYALVACVSGRTGEDARRLVGVDAAVYVGSHGLELEPEALEWRERLRSFTATVDWPVEHKGLTVSFHYREAGDEEAALEYLGTVADRAREEGLVPRFGRKVLELRPPVAADKGTAVRRLLSERGLSRALYAGDDTTDLDAFRALAGLELAVRVAVSSDEAPRELVREADVVVGSPDALLELLRRL
jgi:trehalose 6-phosphate phosphatase